jgi:hypothetical protein
MWAAMPLTWLWIGGLAYDLTGSLGLDLGVAFLGFAVTIVLVLKGLAHLDGVWIGLRKRAGHDQDDGALSEVVVISTTLGFAAFLFWYYVLTDAYVIPFMPTQ